MYNKITETPKTTSPTGEVKPTVTNPPTTKSAPRRYEEAIDLIRGALTDPAKQVETLQQLLAFFEARIAGVRNSRDRDGAGSVKSTMESKWAKAPNTSLIGNK
jgi:hypothetical protein